MHRLVSKETTHFAERALMSQQPSPKHPSGSPEHHAQVNRRIYRATGALMSIQVILRAFGLIEKMIMARYFGTGAEANAYSAAKKIAAPVLALGDQVIMHSFLPSFVQRMRERGERDAWKMASTCINIMILLMALVAVLGVVFTKNVLNIYAHGWMKDQHLVALTIHLTRVMVVAMIFLAISSFTYCLLNSYKQFALPAAADLALKGTVLVFAILFAREWGAYALAIGFVIGAVAKVAVQAIGLGGRVANYRPVIDLKDTSVRQFALLAMPLILGWFFSTFRGWMEVSFLTHIKNTGNTSAYDYAKSISDLPVTFFPYVFGIALFPFLTDIAVAGDKVRLRAMLMTATRMMILIFVPLAIALILLCNPIVLGLYGSKMFLQASADLTTAPLKIFSVMMLVSALEIIVNQFYFAMSDTVRPTVVGMVLLPVYAIIGYIGVYTNWLGSFAISLKHIGLLPNRPDVYYFTLGSGAIAVALALLVYRAVKVTALYVMIHKKLGDLNVGQIWKLLGQIAIALIPFVLIVLFSAHHWPNPAHAHSKIKKLIKLLPYIVSTGVGLLCYCAVLHYRHVDEIALIVSKARGKMNRGSVASV